MDKIGLLLEMELGITGGEEDGVDNTDRPIEDLYSKPEEIYQTLRERAAGDFICVAEMPVFTQPDSSIITTGRPTTIIDPSAGGLVRPGAFSGRTDDENIHFTIGGGFTIKRGFYSFSLDAAADIHDYGQDYSGSATFKF